MEIFTRIQKQHETKSFESREEELAFKSISDYITNLKSFENSKNCFLKEAYIKVKNNEHDLIVKLKENRKFLQDLIFDENYVIIPFLLEESKLAVVFAIKSDTELIFVDNIWFQREQNLRLSGFFLRFGYDLNLQTKIIDDKYYEKYLSSKYIERNNEILSYNPKLNKAIRNLHMILNKKSILNFNVYIKQNGDFGEFVNGNLEYLDTSSFFSKIVYNENAEISNLIWKSSMSFFNVFNLIQNEELGIYPIDSIKWKTVEDSNSYITLLPLIDYKKMIYLGLKYPYYPMDFNPEIKATFHAVFLYRGIKSVVFCFEEDSKLHFFTPELNILDF